jgi:hypothetical protein
MGQIELTNSVAGVNLTVGWIGNFRSALGFWDFPEALRILGQSLQAPALVLPRRTAAELGLDDLEGAIGLIRTQVMESHRPSHQVGELKSGGIGGFRNYHQLKREGLAHDVGAVTDAPKGQFQVGISSR